METMDISLHQINNYLDWNICTSRTNSKAIFHQTIKSYSIREHHNSALSNISLVLLSNISLVLIVIPYEDNYIFILDLIRLIGQVPITKQIATDCSPVNFSYLTPCSPVIFSYLIDEDIIPVEDCIDNLDLILEVIDKYGCSSPLFMINGFLYEFNRYLITNTYFVEIEDIRSINTDIPQAISSFILNSPLLKWDLSRYSSNFNHYSVLYINPSSPIVQLYETSLEEYYV